MRHIIALNNLGEEVRWPREYVPRLRLLGEIFVNALERQLTEHLLAESEERARLAAESASMGLWVLALRTGRYWVTDKIRELFHYARGKEVTLDDVLDRIHPDDRAPVPEDLERAIRDDAVGSIGYRLVTPEGSFRWLTWKGRPRQSLDGAPGQVMGVTFDITGRKEADLALRDSAERLAAARERLGLAAPPSTPASASSGSPGPSRRSDDFWPVLLAIDLGLQVPRITLGTASLVHGVETLRSLRGLVFGSRVFGLVGGPSQRAGSAPGSPDGREAER